jgi:Cys-tRNA(Pro)/Cys-tRNA(Cys) deacylase
VAGQLSLKHAAAALGAKRAVLAERALVARTTGYVLGGVSPLGQKVGLPTVIDETAELWETILVSAGRRGLQVELSPGDLARLTGARFADLAR